MCNMIKQSMQCQGANFDHRTPVLIDLYLLPIAQRIDYEILLLTFKAQHGLTPLTC